MASTRSSRSKPTVGRTKLAKQTKLSRQRRPAHMSLEQWQAELRRQFGRSQAYLLENTGEHAAFSTFAVTNPTSQRTYQVTIRPSAESDGSVRTSGGGGGGDHYCTCADFAVNTLGTCKHIEFVLGKLEQRTTTRRLLRKPWIPEYSQVYVRYASRRQVVFRAGSVCPAKVNEAMAACFDKVGVLTDQGHATFPQVVAEVQATGHELRISDDAMDLIARVRDQSALRARLDKAFPRGLTEAAVAKLLRVPLYPYQKQGALFAARAGRALLADDMGLGKTIQAIAAAELLAHHGSAQRVLIICPTSLKHQWAHEISKFTRRNGDDIRVVEGPLHVRHAALAGEGFYKIVNYDVIHRDQQAIERWSPDLVILDEAQRIKNWKTRAAMTVKQIDSPYAIVLTGTPLENRLEELYSIVEFVDRHRLGPMFRFLAEHQHTDESGRVIGYHRLDRIGKTLEPILLRRTKKQVLTELPPRLDKQLFVPMTGPQQAIHDENREIVAKIVAKWRRYHFLSDADQRRLMVAMQYMRMACNSTYLCDRQTDHGAKIDEAEATLGDLLEQAGQKIVVFSQWVGTHELLARRCEERGWGHVMFHGGVPGPKRKDLVRRFREDDDCRLFFATDAGGVGLNLQHAGAVVIMDQPWNPAVLEQRIGRVHRLGQKSPVQVVHLIARGTIEEGMLNIIGFKQSMFTGVLDGGAGEVFLGGTKLNRFMQSVEKATDTIQPAPVEDSPTDATASEPAEPQTDEDRLAQTPTSGAEELDQAWSAFATAAAAFIAPLAQAIAQPASTRDSASRSPLERLISHDEATGQPCLKLPLPSAATLNQLAAALQQWSAGPPRDADPQRR